MSQQIEDLQSTAISTISSETVSFVTQAGAADAGEIAGVVVYGQLANNRILNLLGNQMGSKAGTGIASSIVFTTDVMDSTLEIQWNNSGNDMNAQIAAMITTVNAGANGAWACHYPSGLLIIKKKTAGTTQAITSYKVSRISAVLQAGDIEIGAVELKNGASDLRAVINPANTARSASDNVVLVQTIDAAGVVGGGGSSIGGGNGIYSNVQGDFTATANSGAKTITLSAYASAVLSAAITTLNWGNAIIRRISSAGVTDTLPMTNVAFSANVLTLSGMAANFAAGDTVAVFVPGPDKGFDEANDQTKTSLNTLISGENQGKNRLMMTRPGVGTRITTATTTTPVSGTGILAKIIVEAVLTGTVTAYDNTAASGTIMTILPIGTPAGVYAFDSTFSTGCTIVTSAADRIVVVTDLN